MKSTLIECVRTGGQIVLDHFGKTQTITEKEDQNSIVTLADVASERWILDCLRTRFPGHDVIAEESGHVRQGSEYTWVIDPLDGTSNFAVGLPWFGVQMALLREGRPVLGAMYLPCLNTLYLAEQGQGVSRNDQPLRLSAETELRNVLCAFGLDASADRVQKRRDVELLHRVVSAVRNLRGTNSLVDFCYTLEGKLGGCVNLNTKIWDIAPACLMFAEAGGRMTDLAGADLEFRLADEPFDRSYAIVAGSTTLHALLVAQLRGATEEP